MDKEKNVQEIELAIASRLKDLRLKNNYSLRKVNRVSDVLGSIGAYEKGKASPLVRNLLKMLYAFDVDPEDFFKGMKWKK